MLKHAYQIGVQRALQDAGIEKIGFQSIEDLKSQAIKGPTKPSPPPSPKVTQPVAKPPALPSLPKGPSVLSKAWSAGKAQVTSPSPSQMTIRRKNIESKRSRLRRLR